jgi:hypothetical protein
MSESSTETVARTAETPVAVARRKRGLPWATLTVLAVFALMGLRGWGIPLWVSIPAALGLAFLGAVVVGLRNRGPLQLAWHDVAMDDPALSPEARAELARAAGDFQALGLELVGAARATLPDGAPFGCMIAADDPRTGIRAVAKTAEADKGRPVRLSGLGFATWLEDGRLVTLWDEWPVAPPVTGTVLLPTTRSVARLYRAHLYRRAHAGTTVVGPDPAATAAERSLASDAWMMEWYRAHGWVRPHTDGSPRFTTSAALIMVLTFLPPGRWLVYLGNRITERALLARAGAWRGPAGEPDPDLPRPEHPEAPAAHR